MHLRLTCVKQPDNSAIGGYGGGKKGGLVSLPWLADSATGAENEEMTEGQACMLEETRRDYPVAMQGQLGEHSIIRDQQLVFKQRLRVGVGELPQAAQAGQPHRLLFGGAHPQLLQPRHPLDVEHIRGCVDDVNTPK